MRRLRLEAHFRTYIITLHSYYDAIKFKLPSSYDKVGRKEDTLNPSFCRIIAIISSVIYSR